MKIASSTTALAAGVLLATAPLASGHSWIEYAKKLAKNGTMVGDVGYPRGYVPRNSTDPVYEDSIPQNILPISGQSAYSGNEILNKYKYTATPEYPMLEAAAGDYVAVMHLENGHTTLPQNQPKKPLNRGTIYFYGTSQPKDEEKLFDVHLLWNKDGSGGDKRGRLLATRNYDDGQCYQTNPGVLSTDRAAKYADKGAKHDEELACQSDIKLPDDLAEGSIYTIYWYWDWPDLNADVIDMNGTSEGRFPWAGTFMRGEKDPNGFTMAAISRNESYSSVMDIKITGASAASFAAKDSVALDYVADQNIYSAGIEGQMHNNFQVDVNDGAATGTGTGGVSFPAVTSTAATAVSSVVATTPAASSAVATSAADGTVETVTVTETVRPPASVTTVYVTVSAGQPASSSSDESLSTSTVTKTLMVTKPITITRPAATTTPGNDVVEKPDSTSTSTMYLTYTTHINQPDDVESSTSTEYVTQTTHTNQSADTDEATTSTSTAYVTITTHITPNQPSTFSTFRSVVTSESAAGTAETTPALPGGSFQESDISNAAEAIATTSPSSTFPGRSFRETLLPVDKSATTEGSASAVQTPSYRRRANWALGDW